VSWLARWLCRIVAVADFSQKPAPPRSAAPAPKVRTEEDLTLRRQGPLGNMAVVPDSYAGPMPPGAVRETDYQRMSAVYGNIASGSSSVKIDTSNLMKDADGNDLSLLSDPVAFVEGLAAAGQFQEQYMGYIKDLVKTPAGLQLLETLDQSKFETRIQYGEGGNSALADDPDATHLDAQGNRNTGSGSTVRVDPNELLWDETEVCAKQPQDRWQPWMRDRPRFSFYHELVHAYHNNLGDVVNGGGSFAQCTDYSAEIPNWEFQTAGIGPYRAEAVSENSIRAQMGAPLRPTYGGAKHGAQNPWRQQKDDEEPPLRSPHR